MKRRIRKLCLFLLLGAIVNVAVAWLIAWRVSIIDPYVKQDFFLNYTQASRKLPCNLRWPTHWFVGRHDRFGTRNIVVTAISSPQPNNAEFESVLPPIDGFRDQLDALEKTLTTEYVGPGYFNWEARGWPLLCMSCQWPWWQPRAWPTPKVESGIPFGTPTERASWPFGVFQVRALPLRPLWPGFAIDTIFYAVVLWLPVAGLGALRRRRRIKRGLCPACAYPIGESAVCTECGRALPRTRE